MQGASANPFTPLVGQKGARDAILQLFEGGRFPHALLIEGEPGSGRRTMAVFAAAMLLCLGENPPCQTCVSCRKIAASAHPDLVWIGLEGDKPSIGVDRIRQMRSVAHYMPHESQRKVFVLPDAQLMTPEAQNAVLKLVEEPPPSLFIIATASSAELLLETLLSRMTCIRLRPLGFDEISSAVAKLRPDAVAEFLEGLTSASTVGQALSMLDDKSLRLRIEDAKLMPSLIKNRERLGLLELLTRWQNDRAGFTSLLWQARSACIDELTKNPAAPDAARQLRAIGIFEQTAAAVSLNVGLSLLSVAAVNRLLSEQDGLIYRNKREKWNKLLP
jgi:DNA polymerase-3 subunit delta'